MNTMYRCALAALALAAAWPLAAQPLSRNFPAAALRGTLLLQQPPQALLNNAPARLSPGAQIRDTHNLLVLSGALVNQPVLVHYIQDPDGLISRVWILTAAERAKQPWPVTADEQRSWVFDPLAQTWSKR
jgi:hypothetical protein